MAKKLLATTLCTITGSYLQKANQVYEMLRASYKMHLDEVRLDSETIDIMEKSLAVVIQHKLMIRKKLGLTRQNSFHSTERSREYSSHRLSNVENPTLNLAEMRAKIRELQLNRSSSNKRKEFDSQDLKSSSNSQPIAEVSHHRASTLRYSSKEDKPQYTQQMYGSTSSGVLKPVFLQTIPTEHSQKLISSKRSNRGNSNFEQIPTQTAPRKEFTGKSTESYMSVILSGKDIQTSQNRALQKPQNSSLVGPSIQINVINPRFAPKVVQNNSNSLTPFKSASNQDASTKYEQNTEKGFVNVYEKFGIDIKGSSGKKPPSIRHSVSGKYSSSAQATKEQLQELAKNRSNEMYKLEVTKSFQINENPTVVEAKLHKTPEKYLSPKSSIKKSSGMFGKVSKDTKTKSIPMDSPLQPSSSANFCLERYLTSPTHRNASKKSPLQ